MRRLLKTAIIVCGILLWFAQARAQQPPSQRLPPVDAAKLCERAMQLMDSPRAAVPELARAAGPLADKAKESLSAMASAGVQGAPLTYVFLTNLRSYLELPAVSASGTTEDVRKQFAEMRDLRDQLDAYIQSRLRGPSMMMGGSDRDGLGRYAEADRKLGPPQAGKVRVVFLGDSITDMWPLAEDFPDRDFVNRGISGQNIPQMLVRMQADVIDLEPAAIIVLAGTNDINARPAPFKAIVDNFKMIAALAEAHHITPLFASLLPVSAYHKDVNPRWDRTQGGKPENILAVNKLLQEFCQQHNYIYVDYFSAVVDNAGFFKAELSDDGVHPNRQGFKVLAPVALQAVDQALQQSKAGK